MMQVVLTSLGLGVGLNVLLPLIFPEINSAQTIAIVFSVWFVYAGNKYYK